MNLTVIHQRLCLLLLWYFYKTRLDFRSISWNNENQSYFFVPYWIYIMGLLVLIHLECWDWNIPGELVLNHCFWCPGSLHHQGISSNSMENEGQTCHCLPWETISTICTITMLTKDRKMLIYCYAPKLVQHANGWFSHYSRDVNKHWVTMGTWDCPAY